MTQPLKKGLPHLPMIIGGIISVASWIWVTSQDVTIQKARIDLLENKVKGNEEAIRSMKDGQQNLSLQLVKIETQQAYLIEGVKRIEAAVMTPALPQTIKK